MTDYNIYERDRLNWCCRIKEAHTNNKVQVIGLDSTAYNGKFEIFISSLDIKQALEVIYNSTEFLDLTYKVIGYYPELVISGGNNIEYKESTLGIKLISLIDFESNQRLHNITNAINDITLIKLIKELSNNSIDYIQMLIKENLKHFRFRQAKLLMASDVGMRKYLLSYRYLDGDDNAAYNMMLQADEKIEVEGYIFIGDSLDS